jgi:hypothetical protein
MEITQSRLSRASRDGERTWIDVERRLRKARSVPATIRSVWHE